MSLLHLSAPKGFRAGGIHCGIKKRKKDLALIYSEIPAACAGVFTTNQFQAAPVKLSRQVISEGTIQAIIANSGNANAVTGREGKQNALKMAKTAAKALKIATNHTAVASTGHIGTPLPINVIVKGIKTLSAKISSGSFQRAAEAIQTTDTIPKGISRTITLNNHKITITAIAKGSGMIFPHMATMLCFICTDLYITQPLFQKALKNSVDQSFNCISVDGCISTNDTVIGMANGMAGNPIISKPSPQLDKVQKEMDFITKYLAQMIAKDGEGSTKLIEIHVTGAHSKKDARSIAFSIANSNLIKASFFGETLNWGRYAAAIGSSKSKIKPEYVDIRLGNILLLRKGNAVKFSSSDISRILRQDKITMHIGLNQGRSEITVWTTDLSPEYVKINMK